MYFYTFVNPVTERPNPLVVFIKKIVIIRTNTGLLCPIFLQKKPVWVYLRKLLTFKVFTLKKYTAYEYIRTALFKLYVRSNNDE